LNKKQPIKSILISVFLFTLQSLVFAQTRIYEETIYNAYINEDIAEWDSVIKKMEKMPLDSYQEKLELAGYYYGYVGYYIAFSSENYTPKIDSLIDKGLALTDEITTHLPDNASAYALKGSFYSFKMDHSKKLKTISLGQESLKNINKAYELDSTNVQAVVDKGNMLFYAPKVVGGNKLEAVNYLKKGIFLIEQRKDTKQNWFYLNSILLLAKYLKENGEKAEALAAYQKILKLAPDFKLVKNKLYPELQAEMQ
jgi:tetratricopeptide (TPR) repeat protein